MTKTNKTKRRSGIVATLLMLTMLATWIIGSFAAPRFSDVPDDHWAASYINALADGGLIKGYGNNLYGPADKFNIDQMATIIANAKGHESSSKDGYWAYGAVDYCINTLKCLPDDGAISTAIYSVPCTRELAFYMLVTGLGIKDTSKYQNIQPTDIPDWGMVAPYYQSAVIKAYQYGLTTGVDNAKTFKPRGELTRGEAATMLYRAGYTTAPTPPTSTGDKTNAELFEAIKNMGVKWTEKNNGIVNELVAVDRKYGGISVRFGVSGTGTIGIYAAEGYNSNTWYNDKKELIDVDGKVVQSEFDKNGVSVCTSGFSYEARQLIKDILKIVYPNEYEAAYGAVKSTLLQETYELGATDLASTIRWYDGRLFITDMGGYPSRVMGVTIGEVNDKELYETMLALHITGVKGRFPFAIGTDEVAFTAYQFDKW